MLGGRRRELARERRDGLAARVEQRAELAAEQAGGLLAGELGGRLRAVARERALDLGAGAAPQLRGIGAVPPAPARQWSQKQRPSSSRAAAPSSTK